MDKSITHATFSIDKTFKASVGKVFKAFSDKTAKEAWFGAPDQVKSRHEMDFKVGGHETNEAEFGGAVHRFEATYLDIIENHRIIYVYELYLNDKRISASLASIEFTLMGDETKLLLTESGIFLDGLDAVEERERGTKGLIEALERSL